MNIIHSGRFAASLGLFYTIEERKRSPVMLEKDRILERWVNLKVDTDSDDENGMVAVAEPALSGAQG